MIQAFDSIVFYNLNKSGLKYRQNNLESEIAGPRNKEGKSSIRRRGHQDIDCKKFPVRTSGNRLISSLIFSFIFPMLLVNNLVKYGKIVVTEVKIV
ncbi:hypothetical protein SAMN05661096_00249 [Marivirga sericea]|uniref:Uncharacterized protein n=1 Tax=Marivirga sericea TaxID=1028 RepID=A0A1X7I791_9BACT|nr:hypothetical protein SAMN05661096_00249 [Marivirga sericea]